jgi:hypothetical protein
MAEEKKKPPKRPVILFTIPGFPTQDPGRKMVWKVFYLGELVAMRALKRLNRKLKGEANFELVMMTAADARKIKNKGFNLADIKARDRMVKRAQAAAAAGLS